jgi:hypothetical protein
MKRFERFAVGVLFGLVMATAGAGQAATCCRVPAGSVLQVELAEPVGTAKQKTGDRFALRLAAPLIVNGRVLLRAGTPGVGEVVQASGPGLGGKAAKLVLAADYLTLGARTVPLDGLQLAAAGKGNVTAAEVIGLSGIVLGPIGFVGMAVQGGNVDFPAGTKAMAKVSETTLLHPLRRATRRDRALAQDAVAPETAETGLVDVPAPPPGQGQVVFFRAHSLLGTGQWFNVREDGQALGKLTNGAYFIQPESPGLHTYTAVSEPELKDSLKLKIAAGETYFVEGILTKGVIIGAADLTPSDRAAFEKVAANLKPIETAAAQPPTQAPDGRATSVPARPVPIDSTPVQAAPAPSSPG